MRTHRCTLYVTVADPGDLAAVVEAVEGLGHPVECPVFDEWSRLRARDKLLREAHALMSGTPWGRCVELGREIRVFETLVWHRWSQLQEPPVPCSELGRILFKARKLGRLPGTDRQIHNIATKRSAPCDFGEKRFSSALDPE